MERERAVRVWAAAGAVLCAMTVAVFGQGETAPGRVPPGGIERLLADEEEGKLPDFDMGKFCYALGLDAARTAKEQRTEIDVEELKKGIADGLAGTGASSSYVYGLGLGQRLKEFGVSPDLEEYFAGVEDIRAGREPKVSAMDAQIQISLFERQQMKRREEMHLAHSKEFLAQNAKREGVKEVDTGWGIIQVQVIREGAPGGAKPKPGDRLRIHYKGLLLDETEWRQFMTSEGGEPLEVLVGQGLIRGLEMGLQEMTVGSKYRFFIPPELGFGREGAGEKIPPNVVLLFDVELVAFARGELKEPEFRGLETPGG